MYSCFNNHLKNCKKRAGLYLFIVAILSVCAKPAISLEFDFERSGLTSEIDTASDSHSQINTLRRVDPVDIDTIDSLYVNDIQPLVQEVDLVHTFTLDADIVQAIDDVRNGTDISLAVQVIDKTIQRVFLLIALDRAGEVKDGFNEKTTEELNMLWDESFAAFDAVDGTINQSARALSEDGLFIVDVGNAGLDDDVTRAFINGQDAISRDSVDLDDGAADGDLTSIKVQRQIVRFSMERGFYLVVLKEIKSLLEKLEENPDGAKVNQKEGEVYHRAIASKVARDNEAGNSIIEAQLSGPLEDIVADTIIREYSKAWLNGTIRELDGNSGAMADGDIQKAIETAHEGILFANMMIEDLEQRLDKTKRDTVTKAFGDLKLASANGFKERSLELRETIRAILAEYAETL